VALRERRRLAHRRGLAGLLGEGVELGEEGLVVGAGRDDDEQALGLGPWTPASSPGNWR
jgi:hypothetical protein